jgi:valyl-tRNA synthetase
MANLEKIEIANEKVADSASFLVGTDEYAVPIGSLIDKEAEKIKQEEQLLHLQNFLASIEKKLSNQNFIAHAPEAVIALERKKKSDTEEKITTIKESLAELSE